MNEPVLVVMAAGMGSRFGGLKQITPVDPQGHRLMDFSLYDAREAGFTRVVFIIKHAIAEAFQAGVGSRLEQFFDVRYAFQELDRLPAGYAVPAGREKPWGTAHAIACAAELVDGPFAVINADDFYGRGALQAIYDFLKYRACPEAQAMVGYRLRSTVTENGSVARGICELQDGCLLRVTEHTQIELRAGGIVSTLEDGSEISLPDDTVVSMNLWGFSQDMMDQFTGRFPAFLDAALPENPLKCEYYLPSVASAWLQERAASGAGRIHVLPTDETWYGITYREDLQNVQAAIAAMKQAGRYPERLWN